MAPEPQGAVEPTARRWWLAGRLSIVAVVVLVMVACSAVSVGGQTDDVEYVEGRHLTVHTASGKGAAPMVVLAHGAGLDRGDYEPFADLLAQRGAVVLNVDWSLLGDSREQALVELACAVVHARRHADDYGGDPGRLVLVAHSAAAAYAGFVAIAGDTLETSCGAEVEALPNALALLGSATLPGGGLFPFTSLGANPGLRVAVVHGLDDDVASLSRSERLAALWGDSGYQTSFVTVAGGHYDLVAIGGVGAGNDGEAHHAAAAATISAILTLVDA